MKPNNFFYVLLGATIILSISNLYDNNNFPVKTIKVNELWVMPYPNDSDDIIVFIRPIKVTDEIIMFQMWNYNKPSDLMVLYPLY